MDRTITITGRGSASVRPDTIQISLTQEARSGQYDEAVAQASAAADRLRAAMRAASFAKGSLKTSGFNVHPEYENIREKNGDYSRKFIGYLCTQSFRLEFPINMKKLSKAVNAVNESSGAPSFSIGFFVKNKDAVTQELLRKAAADALTRAQTLAAATGQTLGELVSVSCVSGEACYSSSTSANIESRMLAARSNDAVMDMTPEAISVSESASFVWSIK